MSISEISSDNEFWENIEKPAEKTEDTTEFKAPSYEKLRISERERYEKTISNIRDSKEEEIRNIKIKLTSLSKKELNEKLSIVKEEFLKESEKIKETYSNSRSIIQKKEIKISRLSAMLSEQEALIAEMRITNRKNYKNNRTSLKEVPNQPKDLNEVYKSQISIFKELCEQYKDDVDSYKKENEKLKEENNLLKIAYDSLEDNLKSSTSEFIEKLIKGKEEIEAEYVKYKIQSEKEIEIREVLNNRHSQIIHSLQEELKMAKAVLNSPRMHYKAIEKLRDTSMDRQERNDESPLGRIVDRKFNRSIRRKKLNYTYKEYKAFDGEYMKSEYFRNKSISRTSRIHLIGQRSSNFSISMDSRKGLSKGSILYNRDS